MRFQKKAKGDNANKPAVEAEALSGHQIANNLVAQAQVVEQLALKMVAGSVPAQGGNLLCVLNIASPRKSKSHFPVHSMRCPLRPLDGSACTDFIERYICSN